MEVLFPQVTNHPVLDTAFSSRITRAVYTVKDKMLRFPKMAFTDCSCSDRESRSPQRVQLPLKTQTIIAEDDRKENLPLPPENESLPLDSFVERSTKSTSLGATRRRSIRDCGSLISGAPPCIHTTTASKQNILYGARRTSWRPPTRDLIVRGMLGTLRAPED